MEEEAQLKEYEPCTYRLQAFLRRLHDDGRLTTDELQRGTGAAESRALELVE